MAAFRRSHGGVALVTMLLIVALVSALLYQLISRHHLTIARTQQSLGSNNALSMVLGAEAYARQILTMSWQQQSDAERIDHLGQPWAQEPEPFEVEDGFLEFVIVDLHSLFNLNALQVAESPAEVQRLQRLLAALGLEARIAETWKDWIDPDDEVTGFGAEDSQYLLQDPPYRAANQLAADTSELRLLHEIQQSQVDELQPWVTVLPTDLQVVNVNTANAMTLHAIAPQLEMGRAEALTEQPRTFPTVEAAIAEIPELNGAQDALVVQSQYFRIEARAEIGGVRSELVSIVRRDPDNGSITLISRDFGKRFASRMLAE
jgi:general secretion pathway protein K